MLKPLGARQPAAGPARTLHRAVTPSDSEGSLAETWMAPPLGTPKEVEVEEMGETEAVLVTVRRVLLSRFAIVSDFSNMVFRIRPPNEAKCRSGEANSIWTTPGYDHHLIKLEKGRDGGKDDREWIFGMSYSKHQIWLIPSDRILPPESGNARAYSTSARAHVRCMYLFPVCIRAALSFA